MNDTPNAQPPPAEQATALPFYAEALNAARARLVEILATHPEVRSAVVVLDYKGGLNDAKIDKAVWIGEHGAVQSPAAIFGSVYNTLATLEVMFTRLAAVEQVAMTRIKQLSDDMLKKEREFEQL